MKKVFYIVLVILAGSIGKAASEYTMDTLQDSHLEESYEIDHTKFRSYIKNSKNIDILNKAHGSYGFIRGMEFMEDWCSPYYKMVTYPTKIQQHFETEKLKAENILKTAYGDNWREFIDEILKRIKDIINKQLNDEYKIFKEKTEKHGLKLSQADYCRLIDSIADDMVLYLDELYNKMNTEETCNIDEVYKQLYINDELVSEVCLDIIQPKGKNLTLTQIIKNIYTCRCVPPAIKELITMIYEEKKEFCELESFEKTFKDFMLQNAIITCSAEIENDGIKAARKKYGELEIY